ncbi:MAG TPA: MATE family efflux transporter [Planctomycetaceae bacterium]|nr:MATE family efflux transporter [Planctomycetaceae bacterium]
MTDEQLSNSELAATGFGNFRELLRVSLPLMLSAGTQSLMNAADRVILAGCSEDALAAVTPASMLHWTVVCVPMGTILYANTFISQFEGAGQKERMLSSFWQAVWLAIVSGCLLWLCLPLSRLLLPLTGHSPSIIELEAQYFNVLCAGAPIHLIGTALSCFFSGRRRTQVVMFNSMAAVFVNGGVSYLLAYGVGPIPAMGIRGAAIGTLAARCFELSVYVVWILRESRRDNLPIWSACHVDRGLLRQFLRYGVPSGLHYFVDISAFTMFLLIVGNLSNQALAATNIAFSINGLIFVPLLGFGTAIQTVVGHHIGAGRSDEARKTTWNAAKMGVLWTGFTGLILVVFPEWLLRPFFLLADPNAEGVADVASLVQTAAYLLNFVAAYSIFDALAVVFSSALRGAGDTIFPMLITLFSSWLIMVVPALIIIRSEHASVLALWLTCTAHIAFSGICMLVRYLSGRWEKIHLIESV